MSGLNRAPGQARPVAPVYGGKHLLILAVIVGMIAAAGGGGYLAVRLAMPNGGTPVAIQSKNAAQGLTPTVKASSPLPSNAVLVPPVMPAPTVKASSPSPVAAIPAPMPAAPPPVPKGVTVSGSAYVVRAGGQSDILRGFHVTLIQDTVPQKVLEEALTKVVQNYKSEAAENRKEAAEEVDKSLGFKPEETYFGKRAKEIEGEAEAYSQILAEVSSPADSASAQVKRCVQLLKRGGVSGSVDSASALGLLETTGYVNVIRGLVDSIKIAETTTDVQGTYKFTDAPTNAYIFAMFDTRDGFLMWAVPIQVGGSKDLFNDTALPSN